jgi:2-iminobutanoate/2-iminopropanoate deaminase
VVGPYSQAVLIRKTLYSSGQIGIDPEKWTLVEWIENQTERVCKNLWEVLKEWWFEFKNVIKTTIFLKDINDFKIVNEIYAKYFSHAPARSTIQVAWLPLWALIEIEVIAKHF